MLSPVQIFGSQATEDRGENARLNCFAGAHVVTDLMKTTLGPKGEFHPLCTGAHFRVRNGACLFWRASLCCFSTGMDKILVSTSNHESVQVTNDGATILKSLVIDNPGMAPLSGACQRAADAIALMQRRGF